MDVLQAIKGRRSVRSFLDTAIEPEKVQALKDALLWAPSAGNLQSRYFHFVKEHAIKERLVEDAHQQHFISEAPIIVVASANLRSASPYGERGRTLYSILDVACSLENMMLLAYSIGLGSVWVGAFEEEGVATTLGLPEYLRPVALVPVGYPAETPLPPDRVDMDMAIVEV